MRWKNERGSVLITLIVAMVLMTVLGAGIYDITTTSSFSELLYNRNDNAYQLAKAGIRYAVETSGAAVGSFLLPDNSKKFTLAFDSATNEITSTGIVNEGTFLEARRVLKYTLVVTAPPVPPRVFELSFDGRDNPANEYRALKGVWTEYPEDGNLAPTGVGEQRLVFLHGNGSGNDYDYRISVNATLISGRGYGIYYRTDGQPDITGYCFQFDQGLNPAGIAFVVRKVKNGAEQVPFQKKKYSLIEFPDVYDKSHQISITVQGNHHIIKVDGNEILNFTDSAFPTGVTGLRSWDGKKTVLFHSVLIHSVPPLATGEIAWWSFEEGDGSVAYGSGFTAGAEENNGKLSKGITRVSRGIFGTAVNPGGGSKDFITVPDAIVLKPDGPFTIEAWARPEKENQNAQIVFKGQSFPFISSAPSGHGLYQNTGRLKKNSGWNAQVRTDYGVVNLCWGEGPPKSDVWYHLLLSVDGKSATLYVNGLQKDRVELSGSVVWKDDDMKIGQDFKGIIDEVYFYKKAMTAAEALGRFNMRKDNIW